MIRQARNYQHNIMHERNKHEKLYIATFSHKSAITCVAHHNPKFACEHPMK